MRSPNGFGKKYFSLASILAHSVQTTLSAQQIRFVHFLQNDCFKENDECDEADPPVDVLVPLLEPKPCHGDSFDKLKTILSLKLNVFIPRCPYYTTYFAFRRTGVHPPF